MDDLKIVVKVGGSLFDWPELGPRLGRWLKTLPSNRVLLVPGGSMQTHDLTLQGLADRVNKLETQNRRLKLAGFSVAIAASALLLMGQARSSHVVEAS